MATQVIKPDGVSGDTGNFLITATSDDATIVQVVSDGNLGTYIVNGSADKTLVFALEGVSDYGVLSGATIQQAVLTARASQHGKGAVTATLQLLDSGDNILVTTNLETAETSATDFESSAYAPADGITESVLNGMQAKWVTTDETQPRLYEIFLTLTYTAAVPGAGQLTISSGTLTMSTGEITI